MIKRHNNAYLSLNKVLCVIQTGDFNISVPYCFEMHERQFAPGAGTETVRERERHTDTETVRLWSVLTWSITDGF